MRMLVTTNKPFGNMLVDDITGAQNSRDRSVSKTLPG